MTWETLCIRFKPLDLAAVRRAAHEAGYGEPSVWIRETVMNRVEALLGGFQDSGDIKPLTYETAGGKGRQLCVRFSAQDYAKVRRASAKEKSLPSPWVRAIAVFWANARETSKEKTASTRN